MKSDDGHTGGLTVDGPDTELNTRLETIFTALADETRVPIMTTLWEAAAAPVAFSDLRERIGMRDPG